MGLDMYLERKTYVKNWDHMKGSELSTITLAGDRTKQINPAKISYIIEEVGYWRKANQIHQWFVDNVQNGIDDCADHYVPREKLIELYNLCLKVKETAKTVPAMVNNGFTMEPDGKGGFTRKYMQEPGLQITNPDEVAELLPCAEGFFFGSTDYDEWYLHDIDHTIAVLKPIIEREYDDASYYYSSSW